MHSLWVTISPELLSRVSLGDAGGVRAECSSVAYCCTAARNLETDPQTCDIGVQGRGNYVQWEHNWNLFLNLNSLISNGHKV